MATDNQPSHLKYDLGLFTKKVWITMGIIATLVISTFIIKAAFDVLLMIFAGSLISIFFHGVAGVICRYTKIDYRWCILLSVTLTIIVVTLMFWFLGAKISQQAGEISKDMPSVIKEVKIKLGNSDIGQKILEYLSSTNSQKLMNSFNQIFRTSFGVFGDIYIILFIGIFFTANPGIYKNGFLRLVPKRNKQRAIQVMDRLSFTLRGWLKGMLIAMVLIAILSFTVLTILGIPMSLALAIFAGVMNFIPNFGPLIAMIPAVLVGFTIDTNTALIIAGSYLLIQAVESNIITPMVQNAIIKVPPAMIIISQLLFGTLTGSLGIILATPLLAVVIVLVDELYVKGIEQADTEA